jgi:hypothetical protein
LKDENLRQVRLRHLASRLNRLGEAPLYHFLAEIVETYASLDADPIKAYRGDRFPEPFAIRKRRP